MILDAEHELLCGGKDVEVGDVVVVGLEDDAVEAVFREDSMGADLEADSSSLKIG